MLQVEFFHHLSDHFILFLGLGMREVPHVDDDVRKLNVLDGGQERLNQFGGKVWDEPDRVHHLGIEVAADVHFPCLGEQSLEQEVLWRDYFVVGKGV